MPSKRPVCPNCGSPKVAEILYGYPVFNEELDKALERKEIVLGGCVLMGDDPRWHCSACKKDFGRRSSGRSSRSY